MVAFFFFFASEKNTSQNIWLRNLENIRLLEKSWRTNTGKGRKVTTALAEHRRTVVWKYGLPVPVATGSCCQTEPHQCVTSLLQQLGAGVGGVMEENSGAVVEHAKAKKGVK